MMMNAVYWIVKRENDVIDYSFKIVLLYGL